MLLIWGVFFCGKNLQDNQASQSWLAFFTPLTLTWAAFSRENNLNSSGQPEAGFIQDVIRLLQQNKAVPPWWAAAARAALLLMTHLGCWRLSWLRGERWEQGWDYPSTPPSTLPKPNLKLSSHYKSKGTKKEAGQSGRSFSEHQGRQKSPLMLKNSSERLWMWTQVCAMATRLDDCSPLRSLSCKTNSLITTRENN